MLEPTCPNCGARERGRTVQAEGWLCHWCNSWGEVRCPTCRSAVAAQRLPPEARPTPEPFDITPCTSHGPACACAGRFYVRVEAAA